MTGKQKCLWAFAIVFGIMAIIFYSISIRELDKESAQILGINAVANIQSTTFAAACAVLCGINVVGAMILGSLEGKPSQSNQINSSSEAIAQQSEETPASNGNATDTIVPAEKTIIPAKNGKCNVCGIDIDVNNPLERNYDGNHIYVLSRYTFDVPASSKFSELL